jgi:hypothetical protein
VARGLWFWMLPPVPGASVKMLILLAPQKFNIFNTFNTFDVNPRRSPQLSAGGRSG